MPSLFGRVRSLGRVARPILVSLPFAGVALATQILEIAPDSLTSYLADETACAGRAAAAQPARREPGWQLA